MKPLRLKFFTLLALLALVAAACGSGTEPAASVAPVGGADEPAVLPPNPTPGETPTIGDACLEGEPECNDTLVPGDEPSDLPPPAIDPPGGPTSPGAMLVDGGLTVSDALATDASGVIAIKGFLLVDDGGARLCEGFAESAPPLCSFASIDVSGFEEVLSIPLASSQGVSWTDQPVSLLGSIIAGTFVVDATVSQ